jgi:hypothetical protein
MFPKSRRNTLELSYNDLVPSRNSPHVVYANLDFVGNEVPKGSGIVLLYVRSSMRPPWTEKRILRFLKKHQEEFRNCLDWLSKDSFVDYGPIENEEDEDSFRERWDEEPEVRFLQQHGLDHGGVAIAPRTGDPMHPFSGLELHQKKARDPLDPICWYLITLLSTYGSVFVRRCGYRKCRKFFWQRTARKRFCKDSCRAFEHVANVCDDADEDFFFDVDEDETDLNSQDDFIDKGETAKDRFRKRRAEYMRKHRANLRRRVIEYRRAEEKHKKKPPASP